MIYQKLENSNTNTERDNITVKKSNINDYQNFSESEIYDDEETLQNKKRLKNDYKIRAREYYKIHGNLNEFMYSTDNAEVRKKFEKWMISFYNQSINEKKTSANSKLSDEDKLLSTN